MTSPLDRLKDNERIVQDLLDACDAVRAKIDTLSELP